MVLHQIEGSIFQKNPSLDSSFFEELPQVSIPEMAHAMAPFVGDEIPKAVLENILNNTLDFDFPVVPITDNIGSLELFHGPTLAFKDVGARFMAQCLGYFNSQNAAQKVTVLVATSGDTGGAVANGFLGVEGIDVVILYPKGKVSKVQEQQLTTLGQNITALEVEGVFDDCQDMVKTAFLDQEITAKRADFGKFNQCCALAPTNALLFYRLPSIANASNPLFFLFSEFGNIWLG